MIIGSKSPPQFLVELTKLVARCATSGLLSPTFVIDYVSHYSIKRWLHSLCPTVKKTAWTREEDELLLSLYAIHSTKWSVIARHIPGRTDDACSKRYREALDPSLKKGDWIPEEDFHLLQAYKRLGGRWGQIGAELCRSGLGCRNRYAKDTPICVSSV